MKQIKLFRSGFLVKAPAVLDSRAGTGLQLSKAYVRSRNGYVSGTSSGQGGMCMDLVDSTESAIFMPNTLRSGLRDGGGNGEGRGNGYGYTNGGGYGAGYGIPTTLNGGSGAGIPIKQ